MSSSNDLTSIEECPLKNHSHCQKRPRSLKGPTRVLKLCLLGVLTPFLFLTIPLYLRYRVYGSQLYPLAMSDMRLIDNKISTTWCQRQNIRVNATFNAFLMPNLPVLDATPRPLTMVRHLVLEDDTKEYWGFYLLRGSSVTVSTCVRWPGASLIVIRGHRHLHECAYIGDDSSEELDELMRAIADGDAPVNEPEMMKRHRNDVQFHDPSQRTNGTIAGETVDVGDVEDGPMLARILEALQAKVRPHRKTDEKEHAHVHRNSTVAQAESDNVRIEAPAETARTDPQEVLGDILKKLQSFGDKGSEMLEELNRKYANKQSVVDMKGRQYSKPSVNFDENIDRVNRRRRRDILLTSHLVKDDEDNDVGMEEGLNPDGIADHRGTINETTPNDYSRSEFWSSFSSSEEALLNCAGLILNLPLTPHHKCTPNLTQAEAEEAHLANTITYRVPTNGYYFFVFNSENEIQPNYIRVQFHLLKTLYNVSNSVAVCKNTSRECVMDLKFFSSEKLVMELPIRENDSLWNEEFVVVSECEPRTALYAICVIAVPVLVILFAFS